MAKYIKTEEGYKTPKEVGVSTNVLHDNIVYIQEYISAVAELNVGKYYDNVSYNGSTLCNSNSIQIRDSIELEVFYSGRSMRGVCTRIPTAIQGVLYDYSNNKVFFIHISVTGFGLRITRLA